ncbi:MAG: DUF6056 family protein, partial [Defluviitaleaceae bacterium]|nr:DUF6056 family protein [Defluviitaleaceae bacterium]
MLSVFLASAFLVLYRFVFLCEDDFVYGLYFKWGFGDFVRFHADHYVLKNGRAIVHLLLTAFLIFDAHLWRAAMPFMLLALFFFAAKCAEFSIGQERRPKHYFAFVLFCTAFFFLSFDITVLRETAFWMSGSFNYIYPSVLLFASVYLFDDGIARNINRPYMPAVTFFACASTEQAGVMAFAALLVCFACRSVISKNCFRSFCAGKKHLRSFYARSKVHFIYKLSLLTSLAGLLTVVLAPGIMRRAGYQGVPLSMTSVGETIRFFLLAPCSIIFISCLTAAAIIYLVKNLFANRGGMGRLRIAADCAAVFSLVVFFAVFLLFVLGFFGENILHQGRNSFGVSALSLLTMTAGYFSAVFYALIIFYINTKKTMHKNSFGVSSLHRNSFGVSSLPLALFTAAAAGLVMLTVAPQGWSRTLYGPLFALVPVILALLFSKVAKSEETPQEFLCKEETPQEFLCEEAFFAFGEKHKEETPAEFLCKEAFFAFGEKHKEET